MSAQDNMNSENVKLNNEKNSGLAFKKSSKSKRPYTNIDRSFMQLSGKDMSDLSFRIICYLMSLPDDWVVYMSQLRGQFDVGKDKLQEAIRELVKKGYIRRRKTRSEDGKFGTWDTECSDTPEFLEDNEKNETDSQEKSGDIHCLKTRQSVLSAVGKSGTNILDSNDHILDNNNTQEKKSDGKQNVVVSEDLKSMLESIDLKEPEFWVKTYGEKKIREKFSMMPPESKIESSPAAWMRAALERDFPPPKNVTTLKNGGYDLDPDALRDQRFKEAELQNIRQWEAMLLSASDEDKPKIKSLLNALRGDVLCGTDNQLSGAA